MATAQTLPLTCASSKSFRDTLSSEPFGYTMGSVGSLVDKSDTSSPERSSGVRSGSRGGTRSHDGLLKKGLAQRELLNYLNITKKEPKAGKHIFSGITSIKREHGSEEENIYTKVYHKDGKEVDVGKNSLPVGGKLEKSRLRPSAFKLVTPKNFSSIQNLYPAKVEELDNGLSNGLHASYAKAAPIAASTSSASSSPSRHNPGTRKHLVAGSGPSQEEENMSDSGHHSLSSLPPYRPPFRPHLGQISASTGHINCIGSLDRSAGPARGGTSTAGELSCRSMATLSRLPGPSGGEAPPPYEFSHSLEDVVRDLEDQLKEKEHELKQMKRNLDESEGAIVQVFEGKQRLWEKEVEELKRLYAVRLRQTSQNAQRSQRSLQLQLQKAQQERRRMQEDLEALQTECQALKGGGAASCAQEHNPQLEETQWEVCQKSGEISLLKQQLRDSQAEVTQKLSEIFHLKTQLRETRTEMHAKDSHIDALRLALQGARRDWQSTTTEALEDGRPEAHGVPPSSVEEQLRAELLLERRQSEAQAAAFEAERRIWQTEKDKVIRYQKELQASYLEMYHKNQALEMELRELRGGGKRERGAGNEEEQPPRLPWIEKIESSEI
ncbi:NEDD4-binding protein 3-A [Brienomyrus brachyistius]|uniref:NEDD4-binding protein 3-A n=1 Tax=Brienomyrus brachyistius TaxID=42636 RepID=UPI0020B2FA3B|nr:NEDD4-binding protein 3-A [Brienomyrus brachyistius]